MSQIYLFADVDASQNSNQAYGPVDSQNFRVQSKHEVTGTKPAVAVVGGHVLAVQDPNDSSKINLILKPNHNELSEIFGYKIAFMVYKGIKKESLVKDGTQDENGQYELKDKGENDLIDHLRDTNDDNNNANGTSYDPGSNMLGLHLTDDNSMDEEAIDWLFRYDDDFGPVEVNAGDTLGNFAHEDNEEPDCAFEIYLHRFIEDHIVKESRNFDNEVTADSNDPPAKKEQILNYLDPAAFYGEYCKDECTVVVKDENDNEDEYEGKDAIFNNILSRFENKDALYLDIRNDNFYSYNFYEQFDIEGENIKYEFDGYNEEKTLYGSMHDQGSPDDWPIQVIRTQDITGLENHADPEIDLKIRFVHYPESKANVLIRNKRAKIEKDEIKWFNSSEWWRRQYLRIIDDKEIEGEWTEPFTMEIDLYNNGTGASSLIAGYYRIMYNRKEINPNHDQNDNPFPKKGILDNLFPIVEKPKLKPEEDTRVFMTGFERFVFFEPEDTENIPFRFYGVFKFGYVFEQNNAGGNRVILLAFADEVYFHPDDDNPGNLSKMETHKASGLSDGIQLENYFKMSTPTGVNPSVFFQKVEEGSDNIKVLRFEPGPIAPDSLPDFNLQSNYLAVYLTENEYEKLKNEDASEQDLDPKKHLRFLKLEGYENNEMQKEKQYFHENESPKPRFTHYYRSPLGIKGFDSNENYLEKEDGNEMDFSSLQGHDVDSELRTFNKLVYSTPTAANNEPGAKELENVSDHYFILPDEVFDENAPEYDEVEKLKLAIRDLYGLIPNHVSAVWSKYIHEGFKLGISLIEVKEDKVSSNEFPHPLFESEYNYDNLDKNFLETYPYSHFFEFISSWTENRIKNRFINIAGYHRLTGSIQIKEDTGEDPFEVTGLYMRSPFEIFHSRPNDFQNLDDRFKLIDLFIATALSKSNEVIENELDDIANNNDSLLNLDESDFHKFFNMVFEQENGEYRKPSEIRKEFQPKFNVKRDGNFREHLEHIREKGDLTINPEVLIDNIARLKERLDIILNNGSSSVEDWQDVVDPFVFYGSDPHNPITNTEYPVGGTNYEEFDSQHFDGFDNLSYQQYLLYIKQAVENYSHGSIKLKDLIKHNRHRDGRLFNLKSGFDEQAHPSYSKPFYVHSLIALNINNINTQRPPSWEVPIPDKAKRIYWADVLAHELGHAIAYLIYPERAYAYERNIRPAHKEEDDKSVTFPNYPYYYPGGHYRGSFTGFYACTLDAKVMHQQNQRYKDYLESEGLLGSGGRVELLNNKHKYDGGEDNVSEEINYDDSHDQGYCHNNLDPDFLKDS